ncbi:MAG: SDR family oxidoreductase [Ignavibacteria bacterium]|nr:SDR family oxidoreductase [Ignavibacteria bacterium]MBK7252394.1 SDR family oxidoreductase [Ignavibacteria bacterium]MBK8383174.1 SDR family oxidoreductase [Ignavibacteria bacterium]MBK9403022.1 SDR family oxidoreductase [Ignavibacteria bacterium]
MKILLTGSTGYIGKRLLPVLTEQGHHVICCVRDKNRFEKKEYYNDNISLFEVDFLKEINPENIPAEFDVAFYLIHSMSSSISEFSEFETDCANNFVSFIKKTNCRQIIYLSGIANAPELSEHLLSRKNVEEILKRSSIPVTILRAGIIVGSGSASFEIIRDLVEKLPVMITPKWLNTKCQPIAIRDVIKFLTGVMLNDKCFGGTFDIGGPEILSYREVLLGYAEVRKLKRFIITLPVMSPRLSSYWLYFVTSTSYKLAVNLVESMKIEVVCRNNDLQKMLNIETIGYKKSVELAFEKIEQNMVLSSWKDSLITSSAYGSISENIQVPEFGCFKDRKEIEIKNDPEQVLDNVWSIGGERGWYYGNTLWRIRGYLDRLSGGVGLRRGRTNLNRLASGDVLDFWRVIVADRDEQRLLLYAEMKLPGEAWLEFKIIQKGKKQFLTQTATFRPSGLPGRIYWYLLLPFHFFIFDGMINNIEKHKIKTG